MADKVILIGATAGLLYYLYEKYYPEDSQAYAKPPDDDDNDDSMLPFLINLGETIIATIIFDMLGRRVGTLIERRALAKAEQVAVRKAISEAGEKAATEAAEKGATKAEQQAARDAGEKAMGRELEDKFGLKVANEAAAKMEAKAAQKAVADAGEATAKRAAAAGLDEAGQLAAREVGEKAASETAAKKLATEAGETAAKRAAAAGASTAEQQLAREATEKITLELAGKKTEQLAATKAATAAAEKVAREIAEAAGKKAAEDALARGATAAAAEVAAKKATEEAAAAAAKAAAEKLAAEKTATAAAEKAAVAAAKAGADKIAQDAIAAAARRASLEISEAAAKAAAAKIAEEAAARALAAATRAGVDKAATVAAQVALEKATAASLATVAEKEVAERLASEIAVKAATDLSEKAAEKITSGVAGRITADMATTEAFAILKATAAHAEQAAVARFALQRAEKVAARLASETGGKLAENIGMRIARRIADAVLQRMERLAAKLAGVAVIKKAATEAGVHMAVKLVGMSAKVAATANNPFTVILAAITVISITLMIALDLNDESFLDCPPGDFALSSIPEPARIILEAIPLIGDLMTLLDPVLCLGLRCDPGEDDDGLFCYPKPHPDFKCVGFLCYADYPEFAELSHTFAHVTKKILMDTGEIPLYPPMIKSRYGGERPGVQSLLLFYENIDTATDKYDVVLGVAWSKCPEGYTDRGVFCDNYYYRETGTLRDCPDGWINDGLICREPLGGGNLELFPCAPGDRDDGLLCWGTENYAPPPPLSPDADAAEKSNEFKRANGKNPAKWGIAKSNPPIGGGYFENSDNKNQCIDPINRNVFDRITVCPPEYIITKDKDGNKKCLKNEDWKDSRLQECAEYTTNGDTYDESRTYRVGEVVIWNKDPYELVAFFGGSGFSPQYWSAYNTEVFQYPSGTRHEHDTYVVSDASWLVPNAIVDERASGVEPGGWWIPALAKIRLAEDVRVAEWNAVVDNWAKTDTWNETAIYEIGQLVEYRGDGNVPLLVEEFYTEKPGSLPNYTCIKVPTQRYTKTEKYIDIGGMQSRTKDLWIWTESLSSTDTVYMPPDLDSNHWTLTSKGENTARAEVARHNYDTWIGNTFDSNGVKTGTMYYAKGDMVVFKDKQIYVSLLEKNNGIVPIGNPLAWVRMITIPDDKLDKFEITLNPVSNTKLTYKQVLLPVTAMKNAVNLQIRYTVVQDQVFDEELIYKSGHRAIFRGDTWKLRTTPAYEMSNRYDGCITKTKQPNLYNLTLSPGDTSKIDNYTHLEPWFPIEDNFDCHKLYMAGNIVTHVLTRYRLDRNLDEHLRDVLKTYIKKDMNNQFCGMAPPLMPTYWTKLNWVGKQPQPE